MQIRNTVNIEQTNSIISAAFSHGLNSYRERIRTFHQSENIHPAKGDMTIMRTEKQNELTDISVALCSGGTI